MTPVSILIIAHALVAAEANPLTDLQKQVASKYAQLVNVYDKDHQDYHRFKAMSVTLDGDDAIADRIDRHERRERHEYNIDYVNVVDVTRAGKPWKKRVMDELFSISRKKAPGVKIPYFCRALKSYDPDVNDKSEAKRVSSAVAAYRSVIQELLSPLPDEDLKVPIYLVVFVGNHYGNCKYVKVYVGDRASDGDRSETSGRFFVLDVSVYDHY